MIIRAEPLGWFDKVVAAVTPAFAALPVDPTTENTIVEGGAMDMWKSLQPVSTSPRIDWITIALIGGAAWLILRK